MRRKASHRMHAELSTSVMLCAILHTLFFVDTKVMSQNTDQLNTTRTLLASREDNFKSHRLIVSSSYMTTENRTKASKICSDWVSIIKRKYPSRSSMIKSYADREKVLQQKLTGISHFTIDYADRDTVLIKDYGDKAGNDESMPKLISLLQNHEWTHYTPSTRLGNSVVPAQGSALINKQFRGLKPIPVLLGFGLESDQLFTLSEQSKPKGYYSWDEIIELNQKGTIELLPSDIVSSDGTKHRCKLLQITTEKGSNSPIGFYRWDIFLDIEKGLCPVKVIGYTSTDPKDGESYRIVDYVIEYHNLKLLDSGLYLPHEMSYTTYEDFFIPDESKNMEDWRKISLDVGKTVVRLDSVKNDDNITSKSLEVSLPAGTRISNHVTGYTFVVGSAGEAIDKTAIAVKQHLGFAERQPSGLGWKTIVIASAGIGILILLLYVSLTFARIYKRGE